VFAQFGQHVNSVTRVMFRDRARPYRRYMSKAKTPVGAGVIATAALVILFGNQAVTEWVQNHTSAGNFGGWFMRQLTWPAWLISPDQGKDLDFRDVLAFDLRAVFLILFVALILAMVAKSIAGKGGAFLLGWSALIFASALSGFLTAFILTDATLLRALSAAQGGSAYGLFVGWIVGIATASVKSS
jgi:hypothetical protein